MHRLSPLALLGGLLGAAGSPAVLQGQPPTEKKLGWSDKAELTFVTSASNAEATTLGLRNTATRLWENAEHKLESAAFRAETATIVRTAVGSSAEDFRVEKETLRAVTAENYLLRTGYERKVNLHWRWYASAGWNRNEFAGIANRFFVSGGLGNLWFDDGRGKLRTDYGLSVTREEQVSEIEETFVGLRFTSDYSRQLTSTTAYTNLTIFEQNQEDTADGRLDTINSVAVTINQRLALKVSYQLLYDNQPSRVSAPLELPCGIPAGVRVFFPVGKLDILFNVALVINF